jgi:hypothetical protein
VNPDFLKKLAQITAALRGGLVFNPLDELQKRATQYGEGMGLQFEKMAAQAGYAKSHPQSERAQRKMFNNGMQNAFMLMTGKPEAAAEKPILIPAIKTLDGRIVDGITHAHAYMDAGITEPLPPKLEGYTDPTGKKFYTRQAAEKLMKAWMSPSVKAQVAERSRQAGKPMGVTTEDLNGKLYANRGTKADEPITGDEFDKIVEKYRREKGKGAALDSVAVRFGPKRTTIGPNDPYGEMTPPTPSGKPDVTPQETVSKAAIRFPDGTIIDGRTHLDAAQEASLNGYGLEDAEDGFLTSSGRFLNRWEAYDLAEKSNQVAPGSMPRLGSEVLTENGNAKPAENWLAPHISVGPKRTTIGPNDPIPPFWGTRLHDALTKNGGFTIDPQTGADLTSGYSVGGGEKSGVLLKKPLADLKPTELQDFLNANRSKLKPGQAWGGWVDNGHVYVEPADQVTDVNEAQRLGNARGEKAIWDHANKKEIPLKLQKAETAAATSDEFNDVLNKWTSAWAGFKDLGQRISSIHEDNRQDLISALQNPSHPLSPWLTKYVQRDLERPNGASPEKIARVEDMAHDAFTGPQFKKWLEAGVGTGNWYDTRKTQARAIVALGDKLGPEAFNELIDHMAASTAMSRPENNLRRASWWRALNLQGMLNPEELRSSTLAAPEGMGHIAQRAHHFAIADLVQNGKLNTLGNPKPASFAENLKMNWRPVTFDTRMSNALLSTEPKASLGLAGGKSDATPRKWAYAPIERAAQSAAAEAARRGDLGDLPPGADPTAAWQAQVWGGIGRADKTHMMSVNNPSFHEILDRLLKRSAALWNVTPGKANELFWKGQPLDLPLDASLLRGPSKPRKR